MLHLIRTEGLKAPVFVCTPCTVCHCRQQVWILTLLHSRGLHFSCKTRELKSRKDPQNSINSMYKHNLGREKASALSVIIAHLWALKVTANSKLGVSQFTKFRVAFCHCALQLLSGSVHRENCSNFSTIHWFHSACTSVSMFSINADNCLFLFSCFPVITSGLCVCIRVAVAKCGNPWSV